MITTAGLNQIAVAMGNGTIPTYIAIGTGSATVVSGDTALTTESDRNAIETYDTSVAKEVTYISNFSATELSGTILTEFGLFNLSSGGSLFQKEVIGSVEFVGDRELQIQLTNRYSFA